VPEVATATLTIAEASRATGFARNRLRRHIGTGRFPGAFREATARGPDTGRWRIPISELVSAGFSLDLAALERPEVRHGDANIEIERLRAELAEERSRRIAAETLAEERGQGLDEAQHALRREGNGDSRTGQVRIWKRSGLRGNWLH
jgi:hypothetical protein